MRLRWTAWCCAPRAEHACCGDRPAAMALPNKKAPQWGALPFVLRGFRGSGRAGRIHLGAIFHAANALAAVLVLELAQVGLHGPLQLFNGRVEGILDLFSLGVHGDRRAAIGPGLQNAALAGSAGGLERIDAGEENLHAYHVVLESRQLGVDLFLRPLRQGLATDRKSTRLNSSHANISYAVFCLKKKKSN